MSNGVCTIQNISDTKTLSEKFEIIISTTVSLKPGYLLDRAINILLLYWRAIKTTHV